MTLTRPRFLALELDHSSATVAFDWALCALFIFNGLDGAFTTLWVQSGQATEANPLMAALLAHGVLSFMAAKLVMVGLGGAALRYAAKRRLAQAGMIVTLALYSAVMVIHVDHLRQVIG